MNRKQAVELVNECLKSNESAEVIIGCLEDCGVKFSDGPYGFVHWEKIEGPNGMVLKGDVGFGYMHGDLEEGHSLHISGDYGVTTSAVKSYKQIDEDTLEVTTRNSVYRIRKRK